MVKKNLFILFCAFGIVLASQLGAVILFEDTEVLGINEIKKDETQDVVNFFKGLNLIPVLAKLIKEGGVLVVDPKGPGAGVYTQKTPQELSNMNKAIQKVFFAKSV